MQKKTTFINKILSTLMVIVCITYYIPKTIKMTNWLESGIINGYFFLLVPINFIIIVISLISIFAFRRNNTDRLNKIILAINVIGFLLMIFWFPFIFLT
jgi:heme/copper-type cytochrome/quinol oxidase subunit 2